MAIRIPQNCKTFRPAIMPMAVFMYGGALAIFFPFRLIVEGLKVNLHALLFALTVTAPFVLVMAWVLSMIYTAGFSSDGVYGHSFWGIRRLAQWRDIVDARPLRILNLRWLRIRTADKRVTWVALFQSRESEFRQEIQGHAPA